MPRLTNVNTPCPKNLIPKNPNPITANAAIDEGIPIEVSRDAMLLEKTSNRRNRLRKKAAKAATGLAP
jgi:hypothetical protein